MKTEGKKRARRESNAASTAPVQKLKQEPPQTPLLSSAPARPVLPRTASHSSQNGTSATRSIPKTEGEPYNASYKAGPSHVAVGASTLSLSTRNRMPYFRYFGPTAIMPGFKQMVVKVRGKQHSTGHNSSEGMSLSCSSNHQLTGNSD